MCLQQPLRHPYNSTIPAGNTKHLPRLSPPACRLLWRLRNAENTLIDQMKSRSLVSRPVSLTTEAQSPPGAMVHQSGTRTALGICAVFVFVKAGQTQPHLAHSTAHVTHQTFRTNKHVPRLFFGTATRRGGVICVGASPQCTANRARAHRGRAGFRCMPLAPNRGKPKRQKKRRLREL